MPTDWDESDLCSGVAHLTAWLAEDYYRSFDSNSGASMHVGLPVAELVERLGTGGLGESFVRAVIEVLDGEDLIVLVSEAEEAGAVQHVTPVDCDAVMFREHSVRNTWASPSEDAPSIRRHTDGRPWQAKDIPDELFLEAVARTPRGLSVEVRRELATEIGPVPLKLLVTKAKTLIAQGRLTGCTCGCKGDWALAQNENKENT